MKNQKLTKLEVGLMIAIISLFAFFGLRTLEVRGTNPQLYQHTVLSTTASSTEVTNIYCHVSEEIEASVVDDYHAVNYPELDLRQHSVTLNPYGCELVP